MKIFVSLVVYIIMVSISSCSLKQINSSDEQAMEMLKGFYTSYITVFDKVPAGPESEMKVDSLQQKYCTNAFLKKINALEPLDSDPFLKAQDSNIEYLKHAQLLKIQPKKTPISFLI